MKNLNQLNLTQRQRTEIENAVLFNRLPHALIISSGEAESRLDLALYIAASYLCAGDKKPCLECRNCKKIFENIHPDVSIFQREKDKKEFSVKIVRENIRPDAFIKPNEADGKVFIIKDAETMNPNAQNAFLKILEEPPKGVMFILCCEDLSNILETIRSRSTVYSLICEAQADEEYRESYDIAVSLAMSLVSSNEYDFMSQTGIFEKDKELLRSVLEKLQLIFRDALAVKNNAVVLSDNSDCIFRLASSLSTASLINMISKANELTEAINRNANLNLLITRLSSVLRQAARG